MNAYRRPKWVADGIISAGAWEPLIARRRSGRAWVEEVERYEKEHSEEAMKNLAEFGINTIITAYYKGFGFEAEKPEMEYARRLVRHAHKHGLKVGLYIRWDNVITESILNEAPKARSWLRVDQNGNYPGYDYYRNYICFNCKAYEEYLKKIVAYAIKHVEADMIHFDGGTFGGEGCSCHCPTCRKKFTAYLKKKYARKSAFARERFGFSDLSHVQPPPIIPTRPIHTIDAVRDPVRQEWMEFRCKSFTDFHRRMSRYIKKLNSEVAMLLNCGVNTVAVNKAFYAGVDLPAVASENDVIFDEYVDSPGITDDGVLVSHIPHYKMARAVNNLLISYHSRCRSSRQTRLSIAEAMAFNRQTIGEMTGGFNVSPQEIPFFEDKKACLRFFNDNKPLYLDADVLANVAVWSSTKSLSYNNIETHQGLALAVQTLARGHVPFDIVLDSDLKNLAKYKVLLLPNVESMSPDEISLVEEFVRGGGGVVATERTSQYDEWYRKRTRGGLFGLAGEVQDAEKILVFDEHGRGLFLTVTAGKKAKTAESRRQVGEGRFAYIHEIVRAGPMPSHVEGRWEGHDNPPSYWRLPKNYRQLLGAIKWASRNNLPLETNAPATLAIELLSQESRGRVLAHFLNYDWQGKPPRNVRVTLRLPPKTPRKKVTLLDLDKGAKPIKAQRTRGKLSFTLPVVDIYSVVVIE